MIVIEEMVGMDVLCSDKIGILILNKLFVDKNLVEVNFIVFFICWIFLGIFFWYLKVEWLMLWIDYMNM